jgi:hypothetical protein
MSANDMIRVLKYQKGIHGIVLLVYFELRAILISGEGLFYFIDPTPFRKSG